jgi:hypothetical protein
MESAKISFPTRFDRPGVQRAADVLQLLVLGGGFVMVLYAAFAREHVGEATLVWLLTWNACPRQPLSKPSPLARGFVWAFGALGAVQLGLGLVYGFHFLWGGLAFSLLAWGDWLDARGSQSAWRLALSVLTIGALGGWLLPRP